MQIAVSVICRLGEGEDCDREDLQQEIIDLLVNGIKEGGRQLDKIKSINGCLSYSA